MIVHEFLVRELEIQFWITIFVFLIFIGSNSATKLRYQPPKDRLVRENIITWIIFLLMSGISLLQSLFSELYLKEFLGESNNLFIFSVHFSRAWNFTAIIVKLNFVERKIKFYDHLYLTYFGIAIIIIDFAMWRRVDSSVRILFPIYFVITILLPVVYIYIAFQNKGRFRILSLRIAFGLILLEGGSIFRISFIHRFYPNFAVDFINLYGFPYEIINMILIFTGLSLIYLGYSYSFGE
ncbi:MAG: hypothetical protein GY870_21795 [archaeon]|nr:hypothetical protein [archaeon]